jgi:hypothetical protein
MRHGRLFTTLHPNLHKQAVTAPIIILRRFISKDFHVICTPYPINRENKRNDNSGDPVT